MKVDEKKGKELVKETFFEKKDEHSIYLFSGDLGAGKTTFISSLIGELTGERYVNSPTYTIVNTYKWDERDIFHVDLYRLEDLEELFELGIFEEDDDVIYFVEWPDRFMEFFKSREYVLFNIKKGRTEDERIVEIDEHTLY